MVGDPSVEGMKAALEQRSNRGSEGGRSFVPGGSLGGINMGELGSTFPGLLCLPGQLC